MLSVSHVTDYENSSTTIDTGNREGHFPLYNVGTIQYFDLYQASPNLLQGKRPVEDLSDIIDLDTYESIDLAIGIIDESISLKQISIKVGDREINGGYKMVLNKPDLNSAPVIDEDLGFFGIVKNEIVDYVITGLGQLASGLQFVGEEDDFYAFKLTKPISDSSNFQGTSGAPVLGSNGRFYGLVSHYHKNYPNIIFVISNRAIKKYLDYYFQFRADEK